MASTDKQGGMPSFSGLFLFFGIALAILGLLAIASVVFFTIGTVMVFGAVLVAAGIAEFVHTIRTRHGRKILFNILSSLLYLTAGVLTLANPLAGAIGITLVMGVFFIAAGIVRIFHALSHTKQRQWGWFLFGGILNLVLGFLILHGWPVTGLWVIGLFVGIEMLFHGIAWIVLSTALNGNEKPPIASGGK